MTESITKLVRLTDEAKALLPIGISVMDGKEYDPVKIEHPDVLAVSHSEGKYILYYLSSDGAILDFTVRPTLEEALLEVGNVVAIEEWKDCNYDLSEDWDSMPNGLFV